MLLVLSITSYFHFNIWGCRCSTGPFQYRWLKGYIYCSCYYHRQIGSIHLSHCCNIFPWFFVWDVYYHHILLLIAYTFRENREFVFIIIVQSMMSAINRIRFVLKFVFVPLYITPSHYHHCANLSEAIEMPAGYILSCVWVRWGILSQLSILQYVRLCVFSLPISLVMIEIIYIYFVLLSSSYRKFELLPLFRVRSWNNGVRCMSFCILIAIFLNAI